MRRDRHSTAHLAGFWASCVLSAASLVPGTILAQTASPVTGLQKVFSPDPAQDSESPKLALAQCPDGKKAIGGGGWTHSVSSARETVGLPESSPTLEESTEAAADGRERLVLTQLEPFDDGYQVTASELAPGIDDIWWVQAYAICADADSLSRRQVVSAATPLSSQSVQQAKAVCPDGKRVLGTGARINNPGDEVALQVARSSGPGDIARGQAHEDADGYDRRWNVVSFAVCADPPPGYEVVFGESEGRASEATKVAFTECPGNKRLHDSGGAISFDAPGNVSLQVIYPFNDLDRAEAAAVENEPTNQNWDFIVAQAVCAD